MFGLEKRGETLFSCRVNSTKKMAILISHFLRFGALKVLTGDYFVLRINKNNTFQTRNWIFYSF